MNLLNTCSIDEIYNSLDDILNIPRGSVKDFISCNLQRLLNRQYWEGDLDLFYERFSLPANFCLKEITIHHITTRLGDIHNETFTIDNLETVLLSDNTLTRWLKKYKIEFKQDQGICVYYKGCIHEFKSYGEERLQKRLKALDDSCVNGFLFAEKMMGCYASLTSMPEIFSDLMNSLDRTDLMSKYFAEKKCYMATVKVAIEDFIFDGFSEKTDSSEKTRLILKYIINYLCYKLSFDKACCFENPIIRLPDNKNVESSDILSVRQIDNYEDIFEY